MHTVHPHILSLLCLLDIISLSSYMQTASLAVTLRWQVLCHLVFKVYFILSTPHSFPWTREKLRLRKVWGDLAGYVQNLIQNSGHLIPDLGSFPNVVFLIHIARRKHSSCLMSVMMGSCSSLVALGSSVGHHRGAPAPAPCSQTGSGHGVASCRSLSPSVSQGEQWSVLFVTHLRGTCVSGRVCWPCGILK